MKKINKTLKEILHIFQFKLKYQFFLLIIRYFLVLVLTFNLI